MREKNGHEDADKALDGGRDDGEEDTAQAGQGAGQTEGKTDDDADADQDQAIEQDQTEEGPSVAAGQIPAPLQRSDRRGTSRMQAGRATHSINRMKIPGRTKAMRPRKVRNRKARVVRITFGRRGRAA